METLFSCRNCIHNCTQSLNLGLGPGFCLIHESVLREPAETTCKYLHRKDLPIFVVDEGVREHAAEFAIFPGPTRLREHVAVPIHPYSERQAWERGTYEPVTHAVAQIHKIEKKRWIVIEAMSSGSDGRRSIAHSSLIRRYMHRSAGWTSSYRLILQSLQDLDVEPHIEPDLLLPHVAQNGHDRNEAFWDVIFCRIAAIQEFGFHSGQQDLMWATDSLSDALVSFRWSTLQPQLQKLKRQWTRRIIDLAKESGVFLPHAATTDQETVEVSD